MTNTCGFGTHRRPTGYIGWYRLYHQSENQILRNGKTDIIFPTRAAAEASAKQEFFRHMNSPIVSENMGGCIKDAKFATAEARLFKKGREITIQRKGIRA